MYHVLIVEDNEIISDFLITVLSKNHPDWNIDEAGSYDTALTTAQNSSYDLFILDYELDKENASKNGLALGLALKKIDKYQKTPVVFETSYPDYVFDAVNNLNCIYYLVKPYEEADVESMIDKILSHSVQEATFTFIDKFGINTYVDENQIIYANSDRHTLKIIATTGSLLCANYSLAKLTLEASAIVQCHKSYAVNPARIKNIDKSTNTITVENDDIVPIGRKYKELFLRKLK